MLIVYDELKKIIDERLEAAEQHACVANWQEWDTDACYSRQQIRCRAVFVIRSGLHTHTRGLAW